MKHLKAIAAMSLNRVIGAGIKSICVRGFRGA
jgi:hypothetical protein